MRAPLSPTNFISSRARQRVTVRELCLFHGKDELHRSPGKVTNYFMRDLQVDQKITQKGRKRLQPCDWFSNCKTVLSQQQAATTSTKDFASYTQTVSISCSTSVQVAHIMTE